MDTTPTLDSAPAQVEISEDMVRNMRIDVLQSALLTKRKTWIDFKIQQGIDDRINEDLEIYYGRADPGSPEDRAPKWFERKTSTKAPEGQAQRSRVRVNITQGKADAAIARVQEILFPIDDRNFSIDPTPVPDLELMVADNSPIINAPAGPDGQQPTVSQVAREVSEQAERAADLMEDEIADQLEECEYPRIGRSVVEMGGITGTGILKGPIVVSKITRRGKMGLVQGKPTVVVEKIPTLKPISEEIDPRNFFPDKGCLGDIRRASGVFERRAISRRELRALAERPGYFKDRIAATLAERPKVTTTTSIRAEQEAIDFLNTENYELWEYHGELEAEHISSLLGVGIDQVSQLDSVKVCVIFVNDRIIGTYEYVVECDGYIYDIFNWKKCRDSVFGYGIVWAYRTQQRVINASWRATMDHAGVSSGASVITKRGKVIPADGSAAISGRKLYYAADDVDDVRKVFAVFDVPSKLKDFIALVEMAKALGDEEINLPQIMQGFRGSAPDQVGSLLALLAKAEGVLRKVVKQYDDDCTKPHIKRYYNFNMAHSPRQDIKGDSQVTARGADVLFMRDLRAQVTLVLAKLTESPKFAPWLKEKELLEEIARSGYINPTRVIKTDDQHKTETEAAAKQMPPDPRIVSAQMRLQATREQIADSKEERQVKTILASNEDKLRLAEMLQDRETVLAKLALDRNISVAELMAQWKMHVLDKDVDVQLYNAEAQLRRDTGEGI